MEKIVQIDGHSNLHRNIENHSVINTSTSEYELFINKRRKEKEIHNRISNIESDVHELKTLLNEILNHLKK